MPDYKKPIPISSPDSRPYWEAVRERRLVVPSSKSCGHSWFPPALLCPNCNAGEIEWREACGRGKVSPTWCFIAASPKRFHTSSRWWNSMKPRLLSNVIGIPPEQVTCEMRVRVVYEDITGSKTLPKFVPDVGPSDEMTRRAQTAHADRLTAKLDGGGGG